MIRIYYHVYAIDGVERIIDEQLTLLDNIKEPYELIVGLSISNLTFNYDHLLKMINPKIIKHNDNEFLTINLIEQDIIDDDDYIFYLHTKGASKINTPFYDKVSNWRRILNHHLIIDYKKVLKSLENFNTCGFQLEELENGINIYSGNFWWSTGKYIKTINTDNIDKTNRYDAELNFIQNGDNWNPYFLKRKLLKKNMILI
jgi:hypothetical protein